MEIWTGTADVTNGDATITVNTGDPLSDANCAPGSLVLIDGVAYFVLSRTDTTTFETTRVYSGSTDTAVAMEISPVSEATTNLVNLATIVARVQSQLNIFDKNSQGLFFNMKGVTGAADPGPGFIAFDDADASLVTEAYIDVLDANGRDVSGLIDLMEPGTTLVVRSLASTAYRAYTIATNTPASGYVDLALTYIGHDGVLADSEALAVSWSQSAAGLEISASGNFEDRVDYDDEPAGFVFLSADGDGGAITVACLFRKNSSTVADWGPAVPFQGPQGDKGWAPLFTAPSDGERRVLRLSDWVGGAGTKPTAGIGQYLGAGGLVADIANATDFRGTQGLSPYQIAVLNGFAGDEEAWLASLVGVDGTDPGVLFNFSTSTVGGDPGTGKVAFDNAVLSSAETIFVSKVNRVGNNISAFLTTIGTSTNDVKGRLVLTTSGGGAQATANVIGVDDQTGYVALSINNQSGASGFSDGGAVSLQFYGIGNQGSASGESVASSITGAATKDLLGDDDLMALVDRSNSDGLAHISIASLRKSLAGDFAGIRREVAEGRFTGQSQPAPLIFGKFRTEPAIKATNPILAFGGTGTWDEAGLRSFMPAIGEDGRLAQLGGQYFGYYYAGDASGEERRIGLAWSSDLEAWTKEATNPVLSGSGVSAQFDEGGVFMGNAIKMDDGTIRLYYIGTSPSLIPGGVGLATSDDGITFTRYQSTPLVENLAFNTRLGQFGMAYVVKTTLGWYLLAEGYGYGLGRFNIFAARSTDGLSWTPLNGGNPVFGPADGTWYAGGVANPKLMELDPGELVLTFNGQSKAASYWRSGLATTTDPDLKTWDLLPTGPFLSQGAFNSWDSNRIEDAVFVKDNIMDGSADVRLFYFGTSSNDGVNTAQIGTATIDQSANHFRFWLPDQRNILQVESAVAPWGSDQMAIKIIDEETTTYSHVASRPLPSFGREMTVKFTLFVENIPWDGGGIQGFRVFLRSGPDSAWQAGFDEFANFRFYRTSTNSGATIKLDYYNGTSYVELGTIDEGYAYPVEMRLRAWAGEYDLFVGTLAVTGVDLGITDPRGCLMVEGFSAAGGVIYIGDVQLATT